MLCFARGQLPGAIHERQECKRMIVGGRVGSCGTVVTAQVKALRGVGESKKDGRG